MNLIKSVLFSLCIGFILTGCDTTSSRPYVASTKNVFQIQSNTQHSAAKVNLASFTKAADVSEDMLCRMMGDVEVAPGKTPVQAIRDAFEEELLLAKAYDPNSSVTINGAVEKLNFESMGSGLWEIGLTVTSNALSQGYTVETSYPFKSSYSAYAACQNVVDAFIPAVQDLISKVVSHPEFGRLMGTNLPKSAAVVSD